MSIKMMTAEDVNQNPQYKQALVEFIYQLADDNFLIGYRGSEWLGLAPHLEADVAFCSLAQDHVGHAVLCYSLLDELGEGKADDLAHLRDAQDFRNAILVELKNGSGDYIVNPQYDWGYGVLRQYLFDLFEMERMKQLAKSSYEPLAKAAQKMMREKHYHVLHGDSWLKQMASTTDEAKEKLMVALERVWEDLGSLFDYGTCAEALVQFEIMPISAIELKQKVLEVIQLKLVQNGIEWSKELVIPAVTGRNGQHTAELEEAIAIFSEVYRQDPAANW